MGNSPSHLPKLAHCAVSYYWVVVKMVSRAFEAACSSTSASKNAAAAADAATAAATAAAADAATDGLSSSAGPLFVEEFRHIECAPRAIPSLEGFFSAPPPPTPPLLPPPTLRIFRGCPRRGGCCESTGGPDAPAPAPAAAAPVPATAAASNAAAAASSPSALAAGLTRGRHPERFPDDARLSSAAASAAANFAASLLWPPRPTIRGLHPSKFQLN